MQHTRLNKPTTPLPPVAPRHPLSTLRFERRLTHAALAERSNVSAVTIWRIESRRVVPTRGTVLALASALEMDAELLDSLLRPGVAR